MSLLANESLSKHMNKDPEGYGEDSERILFGHYHQELVYKF